MSIFEYTVLLLQADSSIDGLWNMFLTLHAAAFGTIFLLGARKVRGTLTIRISAMILYGFFVFINGRAMIDAYFLIDSLDKALTEALKNDSQNYEQLLSYVSHIDYAHRWIMVYITHGVAGFFVFLGIWFSARRSGTPTHLK